MPSTQSPSRRKCSLLRLAPPPLQHAWLLPVIPVFAVGLREGRSSGLTIRWAEAQASQKRCWPHGRKPQGGAELPPQRWSTARLCQHPLRTRSQPELTAAMTPHVSLMFSLERFPGRLSCVKAQSHISAFYRALDAFCTLLTEGCWSRRGCCPDTAAAEFVLPVSGRWVEVSDWAAQRNSSGAARSVPALLVLQVGAHKPAAAERRVTPAAEGESSLQPSCRDKTLLLP